MQRTNSENGLPYLAFTSLAIIATQTIQLIPNVQNIVPPTVGFKALISLITFSLEKI